MSTTTIEKTSTSELANHPVVSREQWLAARKELLAREREHTHARDRLSEERRKLPWVKVTKNYVFEGPDGPVTVRTRPRLHANNGDTCRAAALKGQGLILQPSVLVHEALRSGALGEILPAYRSPERGIYAPYTSRRQLPRTLRQMIDARAAAFESPAWER